MMTSEIPPTDTPEPTETPEPESAEAGARASPVGYWEGKIATSGIKILINVEFAEGEDDLSGTIDIPQQGFAGMPLDNIIHDGEKIHFEHF